MASRCVLDILPTEICERIAVFATAGHPNETALSLARVSNKQRIAVAAVLSNTLQIQHPLFLDALSVFDSNLRGITIQFDEDAFVLNDEHGLSDVGFPSFLHGPALTFAMIPAFPHVLHGLQHAPVLKSLTIMPIVPDHTLLLDTLQKLFSLKKLHIIYDDHLNPEACIGEYLTCRPSDILPSSCPQLESLNIECTECSGDTLHSIIRHFVALRELFLMCDLPSDALSLLRSLESVRINDEVSEPVRYALQIGENVTSVAQVDSSLCNELEIRQLGACSKLDSLHLWLRNGCESSVLEIAPRLRQLRSLDLHWESLQSRTEYYKIADGALVSMANCLISLEQLRIRSVAIAINELVESMRIIGTRMITLHCPLRGQAEGEGIRLRDILAAVCKHNPNLRLLELSDVISCSRTDRETIARADVLKDICCLKESLRLHVPYLEHSSIERYLDEFSFLLVREQHPS